MRIQKESIIKNDYIIPFIVVVLLLALTYACIPIVFETNDDTSIMYTLAGYKGMNYQAVCIFSNVIYGFIISLLYELFPFLPWYTIVHLTVIFMSLFTVMHCIYVKIKKIHGDRIGPFYAIFFFAILYLFAYIYSATNLQFSTTPAFACAAACCLLLATEAGEKRFKLLCKLIISVLFLLIAFWYRSFVGYVALVFYFSCIMFQLIGSKSSNYKRTLIVSFMVACLGILFSMALNSFAMRSEQWQAYITYHKERTQYSDYGHVSYEEAQKLYDDLGWDESFARMTSSWFFMDDRFNAESLRTINEYTSDFNTKSPSAVVLDSLLELKSSISGHKYQFISRFILLGIGICIAWLMPKGKKRLFIWSIGVLGISMIAILCLKGRFPLRSFNAIYIPMITILAFMAIQIKRPYRKCQIILVISILCLSSYSYIEAYQEASSKIHNTIQNVEEYCIARSDNLYIYDTTVAVSGSPFSVYPKNNPVNMMLWGGSTMYSPIYFNQLSANGYESFDYNNFLDNNVYLLTRDAQNDMFNQYLDDQLLMYSYEIVDILDGVYVYKYLPN